MNEEHHDTAAEGGEEMEPRTTMAVEPAPPPAPRSPAVAPQAQAIDLADRLALIEETRDKSMVEGVDYGTVPGTDKQALFKSGSEKLAVLFELDIQPRSAKTWGPGEHLTVETTATVFHMVSGVRMGYGEGLCTTLERKYRWRREGRTCPECGQETVIKGKEEYGGGWLCYKKKGGCGAKWDDGEAVIEGQDVGEKENPDLPDLWNTVIKMAAKRARVDAALAVTGASALFTQDLDDTGDSTSDAEATLPAPTEEQKAALNAALVWMLPSTEAERVWGEIKAQFGGQLYGPVCEAVVRPIRALKAIRDDEAASDREASDVAVKAPEEEPDTPPPDDSDQRPAEEREADGKADS